MKPEIWIAVFVIALLIGLISGFIARSQKYNFFVWWLFGFAFFIVALPVSIIIDPEGSQAKSIITPTEKEKIVQSVHGATLWLCIFLGWAGYHRFYTGKVLTGLLWMFTGGVFLVGWIVDLVMIITNRYEDNWGDPLPKRIPQRV